MILYHGSNMPVAEIRLERCRPYKDFGAGFYTTPYPDQARHMAARTARLYGGEDVVSVFGFDQDKATGLNVRIFDKPSTEWAHFIMNNRSRAFSDSESPDCNLAAQYDIVIGPVADDNMALLFRQYTEGLITLEMLANGMEFYHLSSQYSFHTERAILTLEYKGVMDE